MKQKTQQEDLMIRYLLGDVTEEEQSHIEEQFLTNNQYFEQLCSVEDALIDDYVQGVLTEYERRKVEDLLRSSRRTREVARVEDIIQFISKNPADALINSGSTRQKPTAKGHSWPALYRLQSAGRRFSLAGLALLAVIALGLGLWNLSLQKKIRHQQVALGETQEALRRQMDEEGSREAIIKELETERNKRAQLEQELATRQESGPLLAKNNTALLDIKTASFTRGEGELKVVRLYPGISRFQIRIHLDEQVEYETYSATMKTFDGHPIWRKDRIRPGQTNLKRLTLTVPAPLLTSNDYLLTLEGRTGRGETVEIGDYPFRVRR